MSFAPCSAFARYRLSFFLVHSVHNIFGCRHCSKVWCLSRTLLCHKTLADQCSEIPLAICQPNYRLLYSLHFCLVFLTIGALFQLLRHDPLILTVCSNAP